MTRAGSLRLALALALAAALALCAGGARAQAAGCPDGASPEACYRRGLALADSALRPDADGRAVPAAIGVLLGACARQVGDACYLAGRLMAADTGGAPPPDATPDRSAVPEPDGTPAEHAARAFREGCYQAAQPSAAACAALGVHALSLAHAAAADSARVHFERGCRMGNPTACARAALLMDDWPPAAGARTYPAELAERACAGGSPRGCVQAARRTAAALARVPAARRAAPAYRDARQLVRAQLRQACLRRLAAACTEMGATFLAGDPVFRPDPDSAAFYLETACNGQGGAWGDDAPRAGDGAACARLGRALLAGEPDSAAVTRGVAYFQRGCDLLDSDACADLAYHGLRHRRVAFPLAQLRAVTACNEGSGYGCWVAAEVYARSPLDQARQAGRYRERACALGHGPACTELGQAIFNNGRAGNALKLLRRACTLRHGDGCAMYGELVGMVANVSGQTIRFYGLACDYGQAEACWRMMEHVRGQQGREVEEGQYRSRACRLSAAFCKQKL